MSKEPILLNEPFAYRFPVSRGLQSHSFYQVTVPVRTLIKMLNIDDAGSTLYRSQRTVNESRAKKFAQYILKNVKQNSFYIIPTLTGVIETPVNSKEPGFFDAYEVLNVERDCGNVEMMSQGVIVISMDSTIKLFDGQHRSRGVAIALQTIATDPEYKDVDLSGVQAPIMLYTNLTLLERQMGFSDINNNLSKPPAAISIAYDHRDPLSKFAVELSTELTCFKNSVDFERNSITGTNPNYFSLKTIRDATQTFLGLTKKDLEKECSQEQKELVKEFWSTFSRCTGWAALSFGIEEAHSHREHYLNTYSVFLKALAVAAKGIIAQYGSFDKVDLSPLEEIDVGRWSDEFENRAFDKVTGKMKPDNTGVMLTANKLLMAVGCPLNPEQAQLEMLHFGEYTRPKPEKEQVKEPVIEYGELGVDFTEKDAEMIAGKVGRVWSANVSDEQIEDAASKIYRVVSEYTEDNKAPLSFLKGVSDRLTLNVTSETDTVWRNINRLNTLRSQMKSLHSEHV